MMRAISIRKSQGDRLLSLLFFILSLLSNIILYFIFTIQLATFNLFGTGINFSLTKTRCYLKIYPQMVKQGGDDGKS
jgi:hypothetical protein